MPTFWMQPIGVVRSPRTEPIDDDWGAVLWPEVGVFAVRQPAWSHELMCGYW